MATILSHQGITFRLNGHRFRGFSDDDRPIEFSNPEMFTRKRGKDGTLFAMATGMVGSEIRVRLAPTSPSVVWALGEKAQLNRGARTIYDGIYSDEQFGYAATLSGGIFVSCPPAIEPDTTFEILFEFEQVIPDVDGALADNPPPSNL